MTNHEEDGETSAESQEQRLRNYGFSDHFAGYFKNEKNEKKGKERKRERITGSQQFTFSSYILISVQVIKCSENLPF